MEANDTVAVTFIHEAIAVLVESRKQPVGECGGVRRPHEKRGRRETKAIVADSAENLFRGILRQGVGTRRVHCRLQGLGDHRTQGAVPPPGRTRAAVVEIGWQQRSHKGLEQRISRRVMAQQRRDHP